MANEKKVIQEELVKAYQGDHKKVVSVKHWQEQPNTFALVTLYPGRKEEAIEFGFAKCSGATKRHGPDVWDAQYGIDLAVNKAIAKHAKRSPLAILAVNAGSALEPVVVVARRSRQVGLQRMDDRQGIDYSPLAAAENRR